MVHITAEAKEQIVKKALGEGIGTLKEVAKLNNIGYSTLGRWLRAYRASSSARVDSRPQSRKAISRSEKLGHLLSTASLDEAGLGAYCRGQGLYSVELAQWKEEFMMSESPDENQEKQKSELKALRAENQALKRDLHRKDKALAEASALLIMKKKADLIWGDLEED
jgi:hypothetical protein